MRTIILSLLSALALQSSSFAVKTQRWELKSPEDYARGKLQNLSVTSDGELQLGYGSQRLGEFAKEIWSATTGPDGTIYFGTGSPSGVWAVSPDGKVTLLFTNDTVAVTALAVDAHDDLYAGTLAEGNIFKLHGKAVPTEFCKLASPYVWALVMDKQGNLFAATGPDGKIYKITPDGQAEEWYSAEDANFLCLAFDAEGALLAGGSDRGQLYRITGKNQGAVLYQFDQEEVRALAVQGNRIFVGVNKAKVRPPRMPLIPATPQRQPDTAGEATMTVPGGRPVAGALGSLEMRWRNQLSGALYVRQSSGRVDQLADWPDEAIMDLAVDADGAAIVALAGKGRVYRVVDSDHWELLLDVDEQQALALALRDGRLAFVGAGNVGAAYRIEPQRSATGEFTSEVFDAKFPAHWGNGAWQGRGALGVRTRTGNTSLPGATWSDWSAPLTESPAAVTSPVGRYLQLRVELPAAGAPELKKLALYYLVQNQKPTIDLLEVDGKTKTGAQSDRAKVGDDGDRAAEPKSESVEPVTVRKASPFKTIIWKASDKDGDTLAYRLYYRSDGEENWIAFPEEKPLHKSPYKWDTDSIPDGWYRIKLVASDEESNPAGEALTAEKVSDPVKVDNRRPEVLDLKFNRATGELTGRARDDLSLIASLEYAVDGGDWKYFAPLDGIFDNREERFAVKLDKLVAGPHDIAVRAADEEGNIGVEKILVK